MTRGTRSYRSETMRTISVYQFPNDLCGIKLTIQVPSFEPPTLLTQGTIFLAIFSIDP